MGNDCFSTNPNQVYRKYFSNINFEELKKLWTAIQQYKIKKVFQTFQQKQPETNRHYLSCSSLKQIFSEFYRYEDKQIERIYQIFDFQKIGIINQQNLYTAITICYKAPLDVLSALMFMIFDESLAKKINRDQLNHLVDFNADYVRQSSIDHQAYIYDPCEISAMLISQDENFISIQKWQDQASKIFDFQKYRKFFNIFVEVKLQKQLIQNFQSLNQIYDEDLDKYVSYVIDFKWFELWKAYALSQYGVKINSGVKNPNTLKTLKSFKTKKTLKTLNSIKTQRKIFTKSFIKYNQSQQNPGKKGEVSKIKNYNLINSQIGSKPIKMFNQQLEGQFLEVLAPQLVENMNYALVSQKVWNKLKIIYEGYPQFRRTGKNSIELYPKRIKIYSSLFQDKLDYSSQVIREVPCYTKIQNLLRDNLQIQDLNEKIVYFKTIGMSKWEELDQKELSFMFTQLTSEILIFLAYFNNQQAAIFKKNHCKMPQTIYEINVGDEVKYDQSQSNERRKAIYMGKTSDGRQIIHFKGISHIYDQYLQAQDFNKKVTPVHRNSAPLQQVKIVSLDVPIIPIIKSFGFINSLILMMLANSQLKSILSQIQSTQNKEMLDFLASLYRQSKKKNRVDSNLISQFVQTNLTDYLDFEFGMIDDCYRTFMQILDKNLKRSEYKNIVRQNYYFTSVKKIKCLHCSDMNVYGQKNYCLNIELPDNLQKYFQFTFVPFSSTLKSLDLKKFGLKMKSSATYVRILVIFQKHYKQQISKLIQCQNQLFIVCQVYGNDIIKNFTQVRDDTTLQDLNLKQTDNIIVYELCISMSKFVQDHYTKVKDITRKKFSQNDFVDCNFNNQKWIPGKIVEIQQQIYTQQTVLKVQHKGQQKIVSYDLTSDTIAVFPTRSYSFAEQYHLKVLQRCYNVALNQMLPSNIPLVMILTDWMRMKELEFLIYQQLKIFIAQSYRFNEFQAGQEDENYINDNPRLISLKHSKNQKIKRFKDFVLSQQFPYTISLIDVNGRCLTCHKIHKNPVIAGESQYYCKGCKIDTKKPIAWQFPVSNLMICVDWKSINRFKNSIIKDHKSFTDMIMNKKNDVERIQRLIDEKLGRKIQIIEQLCCNYPYKTLFIEQLKSYPQILIIQIQRMVDNGNNKSINRKHVNFPFTDLKVSMTNYDLTGLIAIQGNNNIIYKNYVLNQSDEWFQIHGETIKKVKKNVVQKCCALFLIYKKSPNQQNIQQRLSDCRQSDEFINSQADSNLQNQVRKKHKQLTINQRLQHMDEDEDDDDFSYLDTQKQDEVQLDQDQYIENDSDIPPERSSCKKQAHYVKNSKELIKSVSQCGKSSYSSRSSLIGKHNYKQGKNLKISNSINIFQNEEGKKLKIKFEFSNLDKNFNYEDDDQNNDQSELKHEELLTKTISSNEKLNEQAQIIQFHSFSASNRRQTIMPQKNSKYIMKDIEDQSQDAGSIQVSEQEIASEEVKIEQNQK